MNRAALDSLRNVQCWAQNKIGKTNICEALDGTWYAKIEIYNQECQRELLPVLGENFPARLAGDTLEICFPYIDGDAWDTWEKQNKPELGARRDQCLSILQNLIEARVPSNLIVLITDKKGIVIYQGKAILRYLPDFSHWKKDLSEREASMALARLFDELLSDKLSKRKNLPLEQMLIKRRIAENNYESFAQLQRDIAALPDMIPPIQPVWNKFSRFWKKHGAKISFLAVRVIFVCLTLLTILSVVAAVRRHLAEKKAAWPGVTQIGDQVIATEEGTT